MKVIIYQRRGRSYATKNSDSTVSVSSKEQMNAIVNGQDASGQAKTDTVKKAVNKITKVKVTKANSTVSGEQAASPRFVSKGEEEKNTTDKKKKTHRKKIRITSASDAPFSSVLVHVPLVIHALPLESLRPLLEEKLAPFSQGKSRIQLDLYIFYTPSPVHKYGLWFRHPEEGSKLEYVHNVASNFREILEQIIQDEWSAPNTKIFLERELNHTNRLLDVLTKRTQDSTFGITESSSENIYRLVDEIIAQQNTRNNVSLSALSLTEVEVLSYLTNPDFFAEHKSAICVNTSPESFQELVKEYIVAHSSKRGPSPEDVAALALKVSEENQGGEYAKFFDGVGEGDKKN
jgi:hypothetical protein